MAASNQQTDKVICLIDMDCFYVQVEEIEAPEFRGKPCGVSQYNPYKGGGLIAVNYEARKYGVKRGMRGEEAKALCPEFNIFFVREKRGKADISKYRQASVKIFEIMCKHCPLVEKASIDEAYIDLSEKAVDLIKQKAFDKKELYELADSFIVGNYHQTNSTEQPNDDREANLKAWVDSLGELNAASNDCLLAAGALIVQRMRQDIFNTLGYHCSAGVAHNKTLAKYCCGLNKPNKQTVLPFNSLKCLYDSTSIQKIKNLGGKLGVYLVEEMNLKTMSDLAEIPLEDLVKRLGEKTGNWLYQLAKGYDSETVQPRQTAKSIGCSKNFRGNQLLNTTSKVKHWLTQLCDELEERLENEKISNQREPNLLVLMITNEIGSFSKSIAINKINGKYFLEQALTVINNFNKSARPEETWSPAIYTMGLSATKFNDQTKTKLNIQKYFMNSNANTNKMKPSESSSSIVSVNNLTSETGSNLTDCTSNENSEISEVTDSKSSENKSSSSASEIKIIPESPTFAAAEEADVQPKEKSRLCMLFENESEELNEVSRRSDPSFTEADISAENDESEKQDQQEIVYEEVDYVKCMKCFKKILCWHMPEHEDFHYAQEVSYRLAASTNNVNTNAADTTSAAATSKKRSIENLSEGVKSTQSSKSSSGAKSDAKKFKKQNPKDESKENNKLDKYFAVFKNNS